MIMKIKKLYAEPEMKLHKLCTSRLMAGSNGNEHLQVKPAYPGGEEEPETGD